MTRTEALLLVNALSQSDPRVQNAIRLAERCRQSRPRASTCSCVACAIDGAVHLMTKGEQVARIIQQDA